MGKPRHELEVWGLRSGEWTAFCSCGWVAELLASREAARGEAEVHQVAARRTTTDG